MLILPVRPRVEIRDFSGSQRAELPRSDRARDPKKRSVRSTWWKKVAASAASGLLYFSKICSGVNILTARDTPVSRRVLCAEKR